MKRKPKTSLGILAVGAALLITATFAARDLSQHTTTRVQTTFAQDNVILVEKFNPDDALDWKKNEVIEKEVFVRNGQDTDDKDKYIYEDAYVRLQIKEYLEFIDYEYTYSDERLMVDTKGDFIKETSRVDLETWMTTNEVPDDARIVELQGYYDTEPSFYIATQQGDVNGEYGVHLIVDRDDTNSQSIVVGQTNQTLDAIDRHHDIFNDEELYTTHTWSDREYISYADTTNPISQFVKVGLGNDVITKEAWIADGAQPVKKWILDTESTDGWVYWGDILTHDNTIGNVESITSNLIESVELMRTLEGQAEYYNRIQLDAVSFEDMSLWHDAPAEIFLAFGKPVGDLQHILDKVASEDYQMYFNLLRAYNASVEAINDSETTAQTLEENYAWLCEEYREFLADKDSYLVKNVNSIYEHAETADYSLFPEAIKPIYEESVAEIRRIIETPDYSIEDLKIATIAFVDVYMSVTTGPISGLGPLLKTVKNSDYQQYFNLLRAYNASNAIFNNNTATTVELEEAYTCLNDEYKELMADSEAYLIKNIEFVLDYGENGDLSKMLSATATHFISAFATVKPILSNPTASIDELKTATLTFLDAYNGLRLASDGPIPEGGKVLDFAGQDWVVLHEDGEGHALIALDRQLQAVDFTKIGITPDATTYGAAIKFHQTQGTYLPGGYETSKLKQTDVAFYNTFIKDHVDNDAVLPVEITQEVMITNRDQSHARTDAPTVINAASGIKTAFSLSMSDMNVYNVQIPRKLMSTVYEAGSTYPKAFYFGLRSPGDDSSSRIYSEQYFNSDKSFHKSGFYPNLVTTTLHVLPCMWITIGS